MTQYLRARFFCFRPVWGGSPCWSSEADMVEALAAFTKLQKAGPVGHGWSRVSE